MSNEQLTVSNNESLRSDSKPNFKFTPILLVIIILALILIGVYIWNLQKQTDSRIAAMEQNFNTRIENMIKETKDVAEKSQQISLFTGLQHDMEGRLVTDDLFINKISFWGTITSPSTNGTTIDVGLQPSNVLKYKGQGKFDLSDRELKAMIDDLSKAAEAHYMEYKNQFLPDAPDWNKLPHRITIQNYEIGNYSEGVFKLKGE